MEKSASNFHIITLLLLLSLSCARAQPTIHTPSLYPYEDSDSKPSMKVIILVLVCAFLFISFFSIYVHLCLYNTSDMIASPSSHNRSRKSARGLDASVLESFPTFIYSAVKSLKFGKEALECAVCIAEFEDSDTLKLLPICDHVFHPECIDDWLAFHTTCPVCRANLTQEVVNNDTDQDLAVSVDPLVERNTISQSSEEHIEVLLDIEEDRRRLVKFRKSHSTGHSLIQPGENCERYTLKLPDEIRREIMTLKRTKSCVVFPREGSCRSGYRSGGEGSSRGKRLERWMFTRTTPIFARIGSVKTRFDCLARKGNGVELSI